MKIFLHIISLFLSLNTFSQLDTLIEKDTSYWKLKSDFHLNATQSSFVNWSAGGRNNFTLLGSINGSAYYEKNLFKWSNDLSLALGGLQYIDKDAKEGLQKTDDKIDLSTNFGYKLREHYYLSLLGGFRTQMLDGFTYPNDSLRVSTFMAPAYINVALGVDYVPNENFSVFLSPLAMKITIVNDQLLADAGSFGVKGATYDDLGNLITAGERSRYEFGAYMKLMYNKELVKNIFLKSKLELFSNYANNPGNIDVNAEALFDFKVNSWFSATLQWSLIYDHDIDITDAKGNVGPRTQFKSVLGLGIAYKLQNFKE